MTDLLFTFVSFVVALGLLIAVHEFGHYWVARRAGVKVLRFSIGFGRPLIQWRRPGVETEYVIGALPLGGYVKMLDEREGEVAAEERHLAFNQQSLGKRFAIVAAGPVFNLLFAVIAFWLVFQIGVEGLKPTLGEVQSDSLAAEAGLQAGDRVLQVENEQILTWNQAMQAMMSRLLDKGEVTLRVERGGETKTVSLQVEGSAAALRPETLIGKLGMLPLRPRLEPVIGQVLPGSVADRAGIQPGDQILRVNDQTIDSWMGLVEQIRQLPGQESRLLIFRQGEHLELRLTPESVATENGAIGRVGITVAEIDASLYAPYLAIERYGILEGVTKSVVRVWDMSLLTVKMMVKMLVGQASLENLSGPVTIAQYAGQSASIGFVQFVSFLALVSISLGVLNLLPIPILDGGHLMYYLIEFFRGKPVSQEFEMLGQRIGIVLLFSLMSVALYNDLLRLLR